MAEFEEGTIPAVSPKASVEKAPVEGEAVAVEVVEPVVASVEPDHKRKHEYDEVQAKLDETEGTGVAPVPSEVDGDGLTNGTGEKEIDPVDPVDFKDDECNASKRQKLLAEPEPKPAMFDYDLNQENDETKEVHIVSNGNVSTSDNSEQISVEKNEKIPPLVLEQENMDGTESNDSSRKIIVPNAKVGVLIGKSGDTIRLLQHNSGAKIQITRDSDADPNVPTRPVELIGTLESINKAEKLIKDVIAEADAGGSPALVARGFGTPKSGAEQLEIQVPNDKVGLIIGKGGDTIKSLQTRSGARIQLIPQHLPEGDTSKSRIVRISGNKKQIEIATEMVEEVMNQLPGRPSSYSGAYSQQTQRHQVQGPPPPSHWGPRAMLPQNVSGYDYQQRGMYSSQNQYPSYGGYQQQQPPRGGYGGWDQRSSQAPSQPRGAYDYYGHGGPPVESQASHHSGPPGNYYGQPQGPGYGQPTQYPPPVPSQHNYGQHGQGYVEPKYDNQPPSQQQMYGPQQPGPYSQPPPQSGYQPPYNRPNSGVPSHVPQSYVQPRPNLSADQMYQAPTPSGYGSVPSQQPYPFVAGAQPIPAAYNQSYAGSVDGGYMQQPSTGYPQQGGPVPQQGFAPTGQVVPTTYPHIPAPAVVGYNQYPQPVQAQTQPTQTQVPSQPNYNEQSVPTTGYAAPVVPTAQTANLPTPNVVNPTGYDQSAQAQPVYGNYPPGSGASVGYT